MLRASTPDSETDALLANRLNDIRRSKLYDLLVATPFIAWCVYSATQRLPELARQIALAKFCIQTDPSVLRAPLILSIVSNISTLLFLLVLIIMFALRHVPRYRATGLYPRFAALVGDISQFRHRVAATPRAFILPLPQRVALDNRRHDCRNLGGAYTWTVDQYPSRGAATGNSGALFHSPPSALCWRDGRHCWYSGAALVAMGAIAGGSAVHIPVSTNENRGKHVSQSIS